MRQLLVAFVAAAALVASQNSAEAVFVRTLVDDFNTPDDTSEFSTPGGTFNDSLMTPAEADSRTMTGEGPSNADLEVGTMKLTVDLGANDTAEIVYDVSNIAAMATNNLIFLTGLNYFDGAVNITASADMADLGTVTYSGSGSIVSWSKAPGDFDELKFVFSTVGFGEDGGFVGTANQVVANPEPATMALMGLGVLGGAIGYRRRRKDDEVVPVEA